MPMFGNVLLKGSLMTSSRCCSRVVPDLTPVHSHSLEAVRKGGQIVVVLVAARWVDHVEEGFFRMPITKDRHAEDDPPMDTGGFARDHPNRSVGAEHRHP